MPLPIIPAFKSEYSKYKSEPERVDFDAMDKRITSLPQAPTQQPSGPETNTWTDTLMGGMRNVESASLGSALHAGAISPETYAETIAENKALNEQRLPSPEKTKLIEDITGAEGFLDTAGEVAKAPFTNPEGVGRFVVEQLGNMLPTLAGGAIGAGTGALAAGPVGAVIGGAAGMSTGTMSTETGAELLSELHKEGVDTSNKQAIIDKINDPVFMSNALERGLIRGGVIAATDIATMGLSKMLMGAPGKVMVKELADAGFDVSSDIAVATALKTGGKAVEGIADKYAKSKTKLGIAKTSAAPFALETIGEGAGEGLAQKAVGDELG